MKKLYYLLPILLLFFACSGESKNETQEPDPVDTYAECIQVPEASAIGKTISPDGMINGHIFPDKQNKVAGFTDRLHPEGVINIVIHEDFYELKDDDGVLYSDKLIAIFNEFTATTGLEIDVYPNDYRPKDYTYFQNAFFDGSHLGFQGGRQYASTGTWSIDNQPWVIKHSLGHIAGLGDETSRPDRDEHIDIDFTNVPDGFGYFDINNDMTVCGEYNYEALVQNQSEDVTTNEQSNAVTDKAGNDLPYITEFSEQEITFLRTLYNLN